MSTVSIELRATSLEAAQFLAADFIAKLQSSKPKPESRES
jgi:hypothetical protein